MAEEEFKAASFYFGDHKSRLDRLYFYRKCPERIRFAKGIEGPFLPFSHMAVFSYSLESLERPKKGKVVPEEAFCFFDAAYFSTLGSDTLMVRGQI
jgi:hypothetical protein